MFSFFKRSEKSKSDDPFSNLKTVSRWMQNLPTGDIFSAQEQVVKNLIQFNHAGLPLSKERLQILMLLDEHARDMQFSLCLQYLRNPRMSKAMESKLWAAVRAYYWEITRGYHSFLRDFVAAPGGSKIQQHIPVIAARAIRGFADTFKWRYFRYERVEEKLWQRVHNIYRIAEFDGFKSNRFKIYEHEAEQSSCMDEYVRALLLCPIGSGSLTPRQVEMVNDWLSNWAGFVQVDTTYEPGHHAFLVDTASGQGMRRIRPNTGTESVYRYISTDRLIQHLDHIESELRSGTAPASLGLGEEFRLPDGYGLLAFVRKEWATTQDFERRTTLRTVDEGRCEVVRDLENICQRILANPSVVSTLDTAQAASPTEVLDKHFYIRASDRPQAAPHAQEDADVERWIIRDRSESGLGLAIKSDQIEWIKIGKLIGLRMNQNAPWQVAIVRRMSRIEKGWLHIGAQLLPNTPEIATLNNVKEAAHLGYAGDGGDAIAFTPATPVLVFAVGSSTPSVILEPARYAHGRQYRLSYQGSTLDIRLESILEKGDGWLMAAYLPLA